MSGAFIRLPYPPSEWGDQPDAVFLNVAHIISVMPMPGDLSKSTVATVMGASDGWQQWITSLTVSEVMALIEAAS